MDVCFVLGGCHERKGNQSGNMDDEPKDTLVHIPGPEIRVHPEED